MFNFLHLYIMLLFCQNTHNVQHSTIVAQYDHNSKEIEQNFSAFLYAEINTPASLFLHDNEFDAVIYTEGTAVSTTTAGADLPTPRK